MKKRLKFHGVTEKMINFITKNQYIFRNPLWQTLKKRRMKTSIITKIKEARRTTTIRKRKRKRRRNLWRRKKSKRPRSQQVRPNHRLPKRQQLLLKQPRKRKRQ
jgi:hypothetical protein